ncbi:MAG TPA: regulatory signaling modulator protein AmpE, partial [Rhodanobacteraceae bacterium]|nr:regulatory signaling modulator protein AmpE [Rhodanobacteraceae bacterium]
LWGNRGGWIAQWREHLAVTRVWQSRLWLAVLLVVPTLAVAWITIALPQPAARLLWTAAVLFLCLGPRDLGSDVRRLVAARASGDEAIAARVTRRLKAGEAPAAQRKDLLGSLFIQSHERLFGPLIWLLVFGPGGAVFYRIASRAPHVYTQADGRVQSWADTVHDLAAWLPLRLTALLYALAGNVDAALRERRALPAELPWQARSWQLLARLATAALTDTSAAANDRPEVPDLDAALKEVLRMQMRALLILLAGFAVYTAGAWLS